MPDDPLIPDGRCIAYSGSTSRSLTSLSVGYISCLFPPPDLTISPQASLLKCLRSSNIPRYLPSLWSSVSLVNSSASVSFPGRYCISISNSLSMWFILLHILGVTSCLLVYANRALWSTWNITFFPCSVQYRRSSTALVMARNSRSDAVDFPSASLNRPPLNSRIFSSPWWFTW